MARLPLVSRDQLDAAERVSYDHLLAGFNARPGYPQQSQVGGLYGLLMHSPELAARVSAVGDEILGAGGIDFVDKEVTCLSVAREANCQLEWTVHEPMSRRAGVREVVIQGIKNRQLDGFTTRERLFVDFSWGVLRDDVPDQTWSEMHQLQGERGMVNLTLLVTFTALICHCMDAFSMELPVGSEPLLPIER
jgi:4-carboxymuconolactone decarboxylase